MPCLPAGSCEDLPSLGSRPGLFLAHVRIVDKVLARELPEKESHAVHCSSYRKHEMVGGALVLLLDTATIAC